MEEDDPPSLLLRKHSSHLGFHDGQGTFSFAAVFGHDEGDVSDGWLDHAAAVVAEGGDLRAAAIAAEFRNRVGRAPRDGEHHWDALLGYSSSSSSSSADENVKVVDEAYAIFDAEATDAEATDDWTEEEAATVTVAASPRHAARSPHHFGSSQGSRHHWGGVSPPKPDAMHDSHSTLPPALRPATHDADNEAEVEPFDSDDKDDDAALVATLAAMLEGEESPAGSDADVEHVEDNCAEIDAQLEREQAEIDRLMAQIGGTDAASSAAGAAAAAASKDDDLVDDLGSNLAAATAAETAQAATFATPQRPSTRSSHDPHAGESARSTRRSSTDLRARDAAASARLTASDRKLTAALASMAAAEAELASCDARLDDLMLDHVEHVEGAKALLPEASVHLDDAIATTRMLLEMDDVAPPLPRRGATSSIETVLPRQRDRTSLAMGFARSAAAEGAAAEVDGACDDAAAAPPPPPLPRRRMSVIEAEVEAKAKVRAAAIDAEMQRRRPRLP